MAEIIVSKLALNKVSKCEIFSFLLYAEGGELKEKKFPPPNNKKKNEKGINFHFINGHDGD